MWTLLFRAAQRGGAGLAAAAVASLLTSAPAAAGWFPAAAVDAGVTSVGTMDLARDGTGAVVYTRPDGDVPHVFVSRLRGGVQQPPERVDAGVVEAGSDPVVAAASGGRLVVAWRSAGRVMGAFSDGGALSVPAVLGSGTAVGPPDADMAIQGTAYVVFSADGDVRAARLLGGAWAAVPDPLDVDASQDAGLGAARPRVAVAADGGAVVAWAEEHPDGRRRVFARRITELAVSALPQEASLPDLDGQVGGDADSADVAIEDDVSFAWVVWRQDFGGVSHSLGRRLVGSLFEPPARLDGWTLPPGSRAPRVSMNGDGGGLAAVQGEGGDVALAPLVNDVFGLPLGLGPGTAPLPAAAESGDIAMAWQSGGGLVGLHVPRDAPLGKPVRLGAGTGATDLAADQAGDFAAAFQQDDRVVVAGWDEPPGVARLHTTSRAYTNLRRSPLRWTPGQELWGSQRFRVILDGRVAATTMRSTFTPARLPADGRHRWAVESVDRRGQRVRTAARTVLVDAHRPRLQVRVTGPRRAGAAVLVTITTSDALSGLETVRTDPGDGTGRRGATRFAHRYRRGSYTLTARATDRAGNVNIRRVRLRIR